MLAALGHLFPADYAIVLGGVLFATDRNRARAVTGVGRRTGAGG